LPPSTCGRCLRHGERNTDINETSSWQDSAGLIQPPARYLEIVKELWSLAEEASAHADGVERDPHAYLWWRVLADNVFGSLVAATDWPLSTAELEELAEKARADAVGRMAAGVE
jgi:hypothetical protein